MGDHEFFKINKIKLTKNAVTGMYRHKNLQKINT
jgi:hypothetical protein